MPTHAEQRVLPYTPEQLFALVADVERYPEFLPWCVGARIRERRPDLIVADLIIGFRMFRERFTSRVALDPPRRIDVAYAEGPFRYLNNHWVFEKVPGGCRIDFFVDFEFKSRLLQRRRLTQPGDRRCSTQVCPSPSPRARGERKSCSWFGETPAGLVRCFDRLPSPRSRGEGQG
ncbi:MAG: type II toxin-antitoxin system RatA family toxin [Alphaproteobacteria bacterium]|nr:MAG: type II toxin-antitoxin system RatA family toxin [Alphaproteobacteria bacterium]